MGQVVYTFLDKKERLPIMMHNPNFCVVSILPHEAKITAEVILPFAEHD